MEVAGRRGGIPRAVKDALRRPARLLPIFRAHKASLVQTGALRAGRPLTALPPALGLLFRSPKACAALAHEPDSFSKPQ